MTPSLDAQNVQDAHALSEAIEHALTGVGGRGQDVIAVLPDSAVRVTLLDFDSLPEKRQEADAAVRFRLRKSLPFDIEKAALSFDAQQTPQGLHVAAAMVLHSVLEEYESAFRAAGCSPGVVLPSSLGALGAVDEEHPTMLLKVGAGCDFDRRGTRWPAIALPNPRRSRRSADSRAHCRRHLSFAGVFPGQLRA